MKTSLKLSILIGFIFFIAAQGYSQVASSYYLFDAIGVEVPIFKIQESQIGAELKIFTNRRVEDTSTELDLYYHFKAREYHQFSAGIGFKSEFFTDSGQGNTLLFPIRLEFFPIPNFKKASILFELAPAFLFQYERSELRSLIGIRYTFNK